MGSQRFRCWYTMYRSVPVEGTDPQAARVSAGDRAPHGHYGNPIPSTVESDLTHRFPARSTRDARRSVPGTPRTGVVNPPWVPIRGRLRRSTRPGFPISIELFASKQRNRRGEK